MSRGGPILRDVYATIVLGAAVYFGLTGADDILNTTTIWERSVGVTATLYGITSVIALYAYWRRATWLARIALAWAILVTLTATLATVVYEGSFVAITASLAITALITASVYFACRARLKDSSTD